MFAACIAEDSDSAAADKVLYPQHQGTQVPCLPCLDTPSSHCYADGVAAVKDDVAIASDEKNAVVLEDCIATCCDA